VFDLAAGAFLEDGAGDGGGEARTRSDSSAGPPSAEQQPPAGPATREVARRASLSRARQSFP
jgi:hypothetical protein